MTLEKLEFLIRASRKETERQWNNNEGLKFTNELLDELNNLLPIWNKNLKFLIKKKIRKMPENQK